MDEREKDFGGRKNKGVVCSRPGETCISIRGDVSEPHRMRERLKNKCLPLKKIPKICQTRDLSISISGFGSLGPLDIPQDLSYN
jgi:hypothetical protein